MENINCEVIQDLIPSYVDKVCSDTSRRLVEEHLATCDDCKDIMKLYCKNDFSSNAIEGRELDGYKKVKAKIRRQNVLCYGLLLLVIAFGTYTYQSNINEIPVFFYYILFAVCMIGTYFLGANHKSMLMAGKSDLIIAGISVIISGYGVFSLFYCVEQVLKGSSPFGIAPERLGPFIHFQWGVIFVILLLLYGYMHMRVLSKNIDGRWILCLTLTGIFLLLTYTTLLKKLDSARNFQRNFMEASLVIILLGMTGSACYLFHSFKNRRRNTLNN